MARSALLLLLQVPVASAGGAADAARARAEQGARAAEGWLRLEGDQRAQRQRDPAPPAGPEARAVPLRELRERQRFSETLETQRRELDAMERLERRRPAAPSGASTEIRRRGLMEQQGRGIEALRLQQRMRRRIESVGGER